jgi:hypothetical protein
MCIAFATDARRFCEAGSAKSLQVGVPQTCWVFALLTGAMYGTYEAFRYKVPGLHKVRYIGQVCAAALPGVNLSSICHAHIAVHSSRHLGF